jgi:hypothetical protein
MVKIIRYTLASVCFAASVDCLALWWLSASGKNYYLGRTDQSKEWHIDAQTAGGYLLAGSHTIEPLQTSDAIWHYGRSRSGDEAVIVGLVTSSGHFGTTIGPTDRSSISRFGIPPSSSPSPASRRSASAANSRFARP